MEFNFWERTARLQSYTFYPARDEFISTNSRFREWTCIAPENGKFEYEVDIDEGQTQQGEAEFGDLIFARPLGLLYRHVTAAPLTYHVFQWYFDVEESLPQQELWRDGKWTVRDTARLSSTFGLLRLLQGRRDGWGMRRREHLFEDVLHLAWDGREAAPNPDPLMSETARLLRERAGEMLTMKEISSRVGLGPVQFTRRFKAVLGQNPIEYLTEVRLDNARKLLIETNDTLDEIAVACGWASGAYLSYVFEKHYQMTPGRFRKRHRV
jgi:AraC family transcriptional regulator